MRFFLIIFIFVLVGAFDILAQGNFLQDYRQAGKPIEAKQDFEVEGSPYLLANPSLIFVQLRNTTNYLKIDRGFYNVLEERIEYSVDGKQLFMDPLLFEQFLLVVGGDTLTFKNGLTTQSPFSKKSYFQILIRTTSASVWVKKNIKNVVNSPNATYGSTKQKAIQDDFFYYMISPNGELEKFKPSKKFFVKRYPQWEIDIDAFIKEKGINFDVDADLRKIISWLESKK